MDKKTLCNKLREMLPLNRDPDKEFVDFINIHFNEYLKLIKPLYEKHSMMPSIEEFIGKIRESLNSALDKNFNKAKDDFKEAIQIFIKILPIYNNTFDEIYHHKKGSVANLYRLTKYEESMWHIPFQIKEWASHGRFSAAEYPCLYIANSIQTCINELRLNNESIDDYYVSCFEFDYIDCVILDLTIPHMNVEESEDSHLDKEVASWPLIALCMIQKNEDSSKWEYLYPQFIIEILAENEDKDLNVKAIKYFSTRNGKGSWDYNIAIPAKKFTSYGHCEDIKSIFKYKGRDPNQTYKHKVSKPTKIKDFGSIGHDSIEERMTHSTYEKIPPHSLKEASWNDDDTVFAYDKLVSLSEVYTKTNDDIIEIANINEGDVIADIGCGTGSTIIDILKKHNSVSIFAIEPSLSMIKFAKSKINDSRVRYFIEKGENIDEFIPEKSIDKLIANASLWQMDLDSFLPAAQKVLKSDGKLIFNLSRTFLKDIPASKYKELGDYIIEILHKDYGIEKAPINQITKETLINQINHYGFTLEIEQMRQYKRTVEDAYNFFKTPVIRERITDKISDEKWREIIDLAYSQIDKSIINDTTWAYFVFRKTESLS